MVTEKLAKIFPERSKAAIKSRWYTLSTERWSIHEEKQLIDKVNGVHFETKTDMRTWMKSASISITNRSMNQCINHWCEYVSLIYILASLTKHESNIDTQNCFYSLLVIVKHLRQGKLHRWETEEDKKLLVLHSEFGNK